MLAVEFPVTELTEHLEARYSSLGHARELVSLRFAFPVSNTLFEYKTSTGRFLLKAMAHPRALYGEFDVLKRLEVVGTAVSEMHRGGLPVEEIVRGDQGTFVDQFENYLLRLYVFNAGRGFSDWQKDALQAARSLRRLHAEGLDCLTESTRRALSDVKKPYPLQATSPELPQLKLFVMAKANISPTYATILDHWDTIEWAVGRALVDPPGRPEDRCVVHTDFHPGNALFHDDHDEATIIDLDNMLIERRLMCLGFTILRFAFYQRERSLKALREAIAIFAAEEEATSQFMDRLVHAMLFIETEKVVRILHRVRTTGQYASFLQNICPLHLANITMLRASFGSD